MGMWQPIICGYEHWYSLVSNHKRLCALVYCSKQSQVVMMPGTQGNPYFSYLKLHHLKEDNIVYKTALIADVIFIINIIRPL